MRILLTGHGCAPNMGSEPGVTWNWALSLAGANDVWVITHAHFRPAVEAYLREHPAPRLHFVFTEKLGWWDPLKLPSLRGIRIHYWFWRRAVLRLASTLDAVHDFDVVHHVGWNTVSAPPLLGRMGKPFVWGPVGGGQTTPWRLLPCFGRKVPLELLRTVRVKLLPWLPGVRRCQREADAIYAANRETAEILRRSGASDPTLLLDCAVPEQLLSEPLQTRRRDGPFIVLWAGRLEPRKAIGICLQTARRIRTAGVRILIAGNGPDEDVARKLCSRLGLTERVEFLGQVPWQEMQQLYRSSHVFLFTSVRDTSGNVAMEALAGGAPVICIDHQGMGAHLPADAAIKLPVDRALVVASAMARAIDELAADRERLARMSHAGRLYAESEVWQQRATLMQNCYATAVARRSRARVPERAFRNEATT